MTTPCNCLALRQATRRVTQFYDEALSSSGLRATQFSLLNRVAALEPVAMNALAKTMVMDRATLGHNVRPLEAAGLVVLAVGSDRRSWELRLTQAGRVKLAEAQGLWRRAQAVFETQLGPTNAADLRSVLEKVSATQFRLDQDQEFS